MPAIVVEICDAIVTRLRTAPLSQPFTAERGWLELVQRQKMQPGDPISILVVPGTLGTYAFDLKPRTAMEWEIGLWVDRSIVNDPFDPAIVDLSSVDAVARFVEEVVLLLASNRILETATRIARCIGIEADPVYDEKQLSELRIFRSLIKATYRVTQ